MMPSGAAKVRETGADPLGAIALGASRSTGHRCHCGTGCGPNPPHAHGDMALIPAPGFRALSHAIGS